jgi:signal peptidase II
MTREKIIRLLIVSGITVILDQITKFIIVSNLAYGENIRVIPGLFSITHALNPGGAFGIFAQNSLWVRVLILLGFSFVAVGFVLYLYIGVPATHPMLANGLALITGGAVEFAQRRSDHPALVDHRRHHRPVRRPRAATGLRPVR